MKPLPREIPPAHSPKWAHRRLTDQLGYLRVRSLANPNWPRDRELGWLTDVIRREAQRCHESERVLYRAAITALGRYRSSARTDDDWDGLLAAIDEILIVRQARHLADCRPAREETAR